ncbi:CBS domain-containing protein, partial [Oscillatoriales cyanobacterium LEGE 11467]
MKPDPSLHSAIDLHPLTVFPDTTVSDAIARLLETDASCVLVIKSPNSPKLLGWLNDRDLLRSIASGKNDTDLTIQAVMKVPSSVLEASSEQNVSLLLDRFRKTELSHLPNVDAQGNLIGLVTQKSLLQAIDPQTVQGETIDR